MKLRLSVSDEATATIARLARASEDGRETGGILLGRGPSRHGLIDVIEAGDAGPEAERHSNRFRRDVAHARELAHEAWTRNRSVWLGEWHTHPASGPDPSPRDLVTYAELLADPTLGFAVFVSVIVTPADEDGWERPVLTPWLIGRTERPDTVVVVCPRLDP